jgi:guanylate kinase
MAKIRETVVKKLWYRAGGRCAFPHKRELSFADTGQLFGRMAHIVARSSRGARGADSAYTEEQLDEYNNLILLCPNHHDEVDTNSPEWTVARLRELKEQHEEWVRRQLRWIEPSDDPRQPSKILVVLWGPSSVGKDVILNRILPRLAASRTLQRFTTRLRRPEEAGYTPFKHLKEDQFLERVSRGEIACVHTANNNFYGFDSKFEAKAPPGIALLTCMRQFHYREELNMRAEASGLVVYNVLLIADLDTVINRTLLRATYEKEKVDRLKTLNEEVRWFTSNTSLFDLAVDNSDYSSLNSAIEQVYNFIAQKRNEGTF